MLHRRNVKSIQALQVKNTQKNSKCSYAFAHQEANLRSPASARLPPLKFVFCFLVKDPVLCHSAPQMSSSGVDAHHGGCVLSAQVAPDFVPGVGYKVVAARLLYGRNAKSLSQHKVIRATPEVDQEHEELSRFNATPGSLSVVSVVLLELRHTHVCAGVSSSRLTRC